MRGDGAQFFHARPNTNGCGEPQVQQLVTRSEFSALLLHRHRLRRRNCCRSSRCQCVCVCVCLCVCNSSLEYFAILVFLFFSDLTKDFISFFEKKKEGPRMEYNCLEPYLEP